MPEETCSDVICMKTVDYEGYTLIKFFESPVSSTKKADLSLTYSKPLPDDNGNTGQHLTCTVDIR